MKKLVILLTALTLSLLGVTPAHSSGPTATSNLSLTIAGDGRTITRGGTATFSSGTVVFKTEACGGVITAVTSTSANNSTYSTQGVTCIELLDSSGNPFTGNDLASAYKENGPSSYVPYDISDGAHIIYSAYVLVSANYYFVYTASVQATAPASQTPGQQLGGSPTLGTGNAAAPAKYAGPEFSGLSAKGIMAGTSPRLLGKNLDEISSIEIGGKAATFTLNGDKALDLTLPEGLAPGLYDLVINSSAGKLTHINAIQVREPRRAFSITTRSEGRISEEQYQEHAIISSMQIPELNKARCMVNGSNLAQAKAQAERLCALVAAANPNIETTVVESRSTVRNSAVFVRVTYGWN